MRRGRVFLFLFFISGGCGLIYEVVWTRLFTVVIGNTVFSVSAILSVFMAGLALGSRIAGRQIDTKPLPLIRTYAALEAAIGIYNLLLPFLLKAANPIFGALYASAYDSFLFLAFARLLIAFVLLIVPATLMGATLPILIRFYVDNIAEVGVEAGRVYTANTLGAALGTAAAGFLLIPTLGVIRTLFLAAFLNLGIAVVATRFGEKKNSPPDSGGVAAPLNEKVASDLAQPGWSLNNHPGAPAGWLSRHPSFPRRGIILPAMLFSGFAALMNEVAWTRVLSLVVGPTTYAFTLMLTSMITGLGLGAAVGSALARRRDISLSTFAWIEVGIAASCLALIPAFGQTPLWIGRLVTRYVESFSMIQITEFLIFFSLMLAPTTLLGMTFPVAARLYAKADSLLGTEVSAIYAFNTGGGILGSLVAGFLLIPHFGSQWTLGIAASASAAIAVIVYPRVLPIAASSAIVTTTFFVPRWDPELMSSGAYKYAPYYALNLDLESVLKSGDLLYFKEGATTTVSAKKFHGGTMLAIDGKVDATDSGDMTTQKMLGHLPLLLSKSAKHVAVIGLGSAVTAGAALQHPIESLDVVEISPEVVAASRFFDHVNHKPLDDRRTRLIVGDGRNHLRYIRKQYDVVISEPSNPWMSGMGPLFSREFFGEVLAKLAPNGIHCQWLHSYNMSTDDLRTIVGTFRAVFPHAQLWTLNENDFLLLGSPTRIPVDETTVAENLRRVAEDLKTIRLEDLYSLLALHALEDEDLDKLAAGAALNTDDHPILEFHAPRFIYANTSDENLAAIQAVRRRAENLGTAENHIHLGQFYLASESYKLAVAEFRKAIQKNAEDAAAWLGLVASARGQVDRKELAAFIEEQLAANAPASARLAAADFYLQENAFEKAAAPLQKLFEQDSRNAAVLEKLADVYANAGNAELSGVVDRLLALDQENAKGLYHLATIRFYQGRLDEAIRLVTRALAKDPRNVRGRNLLAIAYGQILQPDKAEAEFRRALEQAPEDSITFNNYALFLLERGRASEALDRFSESINLNPENVEAYVGLGEAYRQSGQPAKAQSWYRKALQLDPNQPVAKMYVK